jgi:hypothetical protein
MEMTAVNVLGNESITSDPIGLSDSWILIADYFASNYGKWMKSSLELTSDRVL